MTGLVYRGKDNQPLTNSLLVAETFGKEHRNVLRDIKNLIEGGCSKMSRPQCSRKQPT